MFFAFFDTAFFATAGLVVWLEVVSSSTLAATASSSIGFFLAGMANLESE
jgi:hypothetical protein